MIRPRNWDDQHQRVKTDRIDALAMLGALDRFCAGKPKALALVHVPTQAQERLRSESRVRQSLRRDSNWWLSAATGWLCNTVIVSKSNGMGAQLAQVAGTRLAD